MKKFHRPGGGADKVCLNMNMGGEKFDITNKISFEEGDKMRLNMAFTKRMVTYGRECWILF